MNIGFGFPWSQTHWWVGAAVIVLALLIAGLRLLEKRRQARLHLFVEAALAPRLLPGYDGAVRRPLFWLAVLGFAALALTFAQPHWGQAWQQIRRQSHDVIICLDTSESMRAANPQPNRLERSKQKILSLLEQNPGDRFALVAFSGAAELQAPLTHDLGFYKAVLAAVDTDTISVEGTDIAAAIREAIETYKAETEASGYADNNARAIIVISDGEQVSGDAAKAAEEAGDYARVYVIGVGSPDGAEIMFPDWMGRYVRVNEKERQHLSKLDEPGLEKIALNGRGGYVRSTPDNSDIQQVYNHLKEMATYSSQSDIRMRLVNRYQWPLALAFACFAGEGLWLAAMPWVRTWRMRRRGNAPGAMEGGHA